MVDVNNRQQVLAEVKRICEAYDHNRDKLEELNTEQKRLSEIERTSPEGRSREMVQQRKAELMEESRKYQKEVDFFSAMLSKAKERTFYVMFQLYVGGISWDFIKDQYGKIMTRDSIARERRKAFQMMADSYKDFFEENPY